MMHNLTVYEIDYTFESKAHQTRSTLAHFIVSFVVCVESIRCDHNVHSMYDHAPITVNLLNVVSPMTASCCGAITEDLNSYKDD